MYNLNDISQPEKIPNNCIGDTKLQQANVDGVVEDLDSMPTVGGIQEVTGAVDTDLEKGILPGLELQRCSQRILKGDGSEKGYVALDNVSPSDIRAAVSGDLESQQKVLSLASIAPGADKADKGSLAVDKVSSRTSNISQDDSGEAAEKIANNCIGDTKLQQANVAGVVEHDLHSMPKVGGIQEIREAVDTDLEKQIFPGLELQRCSQRILKGDESEKGSVALDNVSPSDTREADLEISSASAQVSITVNLDGENDNCICDVKLQQANIANMVKENKLDSIQKFGGIQRIAETLGTDLEKGRKQDPCTQRMDNANSSPSLTQAPARGFLQLLLKSCNNYTVLLLFVCAALSLGFGVKEEGLRTGWYEGVIIILAIIILVVIDSLRNQRRLKHSQRMTGKHKPFELQRMMVDVIRGGCLHKVIIGDVLIGDLVLLERGYIIPADGLFIDGESLKLDNDLESTINEENPFLFYGAKVTGGKGRMLVASVGMNTRLGDLMEQVTHVPEKTLLPAQIDKVIKGTQIFGLSISILILVVLFLRFMLLKEDIKSSLPDLKEKPMAIKEIMDAIEKIVMKPNGKISTLTTSLATLLVGVMEGIPFIITLAISYWNKKMMSEDSEQAFAQEPFACLTMSSVTSICIDTTGWCVPTLNLVTVGREIRVLKNAGYNIALVSEDNVSVLESIAHECGLLPCSNAMVLEGEEFRKISNEEKMNKIDQIILIGSSIPSDQLTLVQCLKNEGHIVAMVGVKTNAIPALKEADVGITMRNCSTEMARASSGIIIGDGNLSFLVTISRFGRCTFENIQKYFQLELTMNIAGLLIASITTMFCGYSPISSIQLLWANFVVSLLGGIGLLTEPPTEELMKKLPLKQTNSLITKAMWRNIVSKALYQVAISVAFQFKGQTIPGISNEVSKTIIFNSFVLCQAFNQVNARELEKKNVFKSIHRNPFFWVSVGVILILQVAFIEIAHIIVGNARLNWVQWFSCLLPGVVSWASDWVTKCTAELWNCLTRLLGSHLRTINIPPDSTSNLKLPLTHP